MLVYTSLSPNPLSSHLLPPPVVSLLPVSHTRLLSYSGLVGIEGSIEDDEDSLKDSKCRYYETLEFSNVFKENYDFAAISSNIRSLPGKWDNFLDFLLDVNQGEFKLI